MEYNFNLDKIFEIIIYELKTKSEKITDKVINKNINIIEEYIIGYIQEWLYNDILSQMNLEELKDYIVNLLIRKFENGRNG